MTNPPLLRMMEAQLREARAFNMDYYDEGELFFKAARDYEAGNLEKAEVTLRTILQRHSDHAEAFHLLSLLALKRGEREAAGGYAEKARHIGPDVAKYHYNHGTILHDLGDIPGAISAYEACLAIDPNHRGAHNNLGAALRDQGHLTRSEDHLRRGLDLNPGNVNAWNNLGSVLRDQGRIEEALEAYQKALNHDPQNRTAHSNALLCMHYLPEYDAESLLEDHKAWAKAHCATISRMVHNAPSHAREGRQLSIGYVSADFRIHSVGFFLKPLLLHHDRARFRIYCYNAETKEDDMTRWFKQLPVVWRDIASMGDEEAAKRISEDAVDILIDCSGHTAGNRLGIFARKPAPVQVTCLGYPNTTGLDEIDYRLTDEWADPPVSPTPAIEVLFRLPSGFLCYSPPEEAPEVNPLPASHNGYVTFGSFNNLPKLNRHVLRLWATLLMGIPSSRLLLKTRQFNDSHVAQVFRGFFAEQGVPEERVMTAGAAATIWEHLQWYHRIDIALDPFPYNGTTTSYEALYMGVPVITLMGNTHAGRVGNSIMRRMGLGELVAASPERYVALGRFFSQNLNELSRLRSSLRGVLLQKNEGESYVREVERALERMWEGWRSSAKGQSQ